MGHEVEQAVRKVDTKLVAVEDQIARLEAVRRSLRDNLTEQLAGGM